MTDLLTAAQMRAIEQDAIEPGQVTGLELMERAGAGVVEAIFEAWPTMGDGAHSAVVLCGPGNNGGDGFVVARLLAARGWAVKVFLYGAADKLPPDARTNFDRWRAMGDVSVRAIDPPLLMDDRLPMGSPDLIVDALFGTGLRRPFRGLFSSLAELTDLRRSKGVSMVAVDVPSGLCSDSGRVLGTALPAELTVSFHRAKLGHYLADGPGICGQLAIVDIGL